MGKTFTGDKQVKKCPTTTKFKKCIYVKNEGNQIDDIFDFPKIMNVPFPHPFFMKNLYLTCHILNKGWKQWTCVGF